MIHAEQKLTINLLKEIYILKAFTETELKEILTLGKVISYEAFTNIIIEGELSWGLFVILTGTVGIFKANKMTGQSYDVAHLKDGSFFGEMSIIDENPRSATVRSLTSCTVFFIPKESFMQFIQKSDDLKVRFYEATIRNLVGRLRELDANFVISQHQLWKKVLEKGETVR